MEMALYKLQNQKPKNLQKINTIEIYYYITIDNTYAIDYSFHRNDLPLWEQLIDLQKKCINDTTFNIDINDVRLIGNYCVCEISSKNYNLYERINFIPYFKNINNLEEALKINSW